MKIETRLDVVFTKFLSPNFLVRIFLVTGLATAPVKLASFLVTGYAASAGAKRLGRQLTAQW